ncbi:MAG TPA: MoxR family ATPase [Acidimicrobiales bacterium]|nr:MoxR family ATPase [Acidimicrobiales bacterium]
MTTQAAVDRTETFADLFNAICSNIELAIRGKQEVVRLAVTSLVADGHLLLEDAPGVGKTSLAKAMAASVSCSFGRVQFTPDLLPADVVGMTVWNRGTGGFDFRPGPIFSNIVLADEINRASPKTQSALLEAMGERQVTVDGVTHPLASPFLVIATQNPIEHEGTYPLPESQLDRFLMKITVGYPNRSAELEILQTHGAGDPLSRLTAVVGSADVLGMAMAAQSVHVAPTLLGYIVDIAEATRRHPALLLGMSPRAVLALQRVARVRAAAVMRTYVTPDDIKSLARPVIAHRLLVTPEAQLQGIGAAHVLDQILESIPAPGGPGA